jgi:hypothetical protein
MKTYPSILSSNGNSFREFKAYVFAKEDGSNLRFEWNQKKGFYKYGTRQRLFDETDDMFGEAIPLFLNTLADPLHSILKRQNHQQVVVFAEFFGPNSFAGQHEKTDEKCLKLFDVAPYKKGILGPKEFLDVYGHLDITKYLGIHNWTREFVEKVKRGEFEGSTFEGVVGKAGEGHKLIMAKAKTQAWIDKVKARYGDQADKIIMS